MSTAGHSTTLQATKTSWKTYEEDVVDDRVLKVAQETDNRIHFRQLFDRDAQTHERRLAATIVRRDFHRKQLHTHIPSSQVLVHCRKEKHSDCTSLTSRTPFSKSPFVMAWSISPAWSMLCTRGATTSAANFATASRKTTNTSAHIEQSRADHTSTPTRASHRRTGVLEHDFFFGQLRERRKRVVRARCGIASRQRLRGSTDAQRLLLLLLRC